MSWTKRQFVEMAFEEIGYATSVYDLEPEQLQAALRRLDAMLATWNGLLIKINYPLPSSPESSDLDTETGVPDKAAEAIYLELAIRLAPTVGKQAQNETKVAAKAAYNELAKNEAMPQEKQFPVELPAGAGNKPWRYDDPFIENTDDRTITAPDEKLEFTP